MSIYLVTIASAQRVMVMIITLLKAKLKKHRKQMVVIAQKGYQIIAFYLPFLVIKVIRHM